MVYPITDLIENYLSDDKIIKAGIEYCNGHDNCLQCPLCDKVCIDYTGQICALYDSTTLLDLNTLIDVLNRK